ncbi:MAG: arabinose transporter permease [Collimonas fungivorans]|uniref:MFS transporter n=1 Tax=Collimonas fungivorans TaxID=158899 RepID=UPI0026F030CE|nr:MFS transporter [Collimonas fungivorans]MDB5767839.1 arabinose transporter permease [Collimonas fungivorans]
MPIPILALALAAFAIGTTEFVIMGILPQVASDLSVSIPSAGFLVSGYALGVAVGAPILSVLTRHIPKKKALLLLMAIFIAGNLLSAVAPNYEVLMASRVVASFAHGSFFGIGAVVAAGLVAENKRASAIALMFTGLTLANVLGVPLGTLLGQAYGWRATFWAVSSLGVVAAIATYVLVPRIENTKDIDFMAEMSVLKQPQVLLALLMTILGFGGIFTAFTYITPLLQEITGFSPHGVTVILFLFGVGLTLGNTIGGKLADWKLMPSLVAILIALAIVEAAFSFTVYSKLATAITVLLWGIAGFATVPALQIRVVTQAESAPNLASTLNIGAFNLGNAGGAFLGGLVISGGGLRNLPLAAAGVAILAVIVTVVSMKLESNGKLAEAYQ